jgi:hypothetical protein
MLLASDFSEACRKSFCSLGTAYLPLPNSPRKWRRTVFWAIPKILTTFLLLKVLLSSLILRGLARAFGLLEPVNALLRRRREYLETTCPRPLAQFRPPSFSELLNATSGQLSLTRIHGPSPFERELDFNTHACFRQLTMTIESCHSERCYHIRHFLGPLDGLPRSVQYRVIATSS